MKWYKRKGSWAGAFILALLSALGITQTQTADVQLTWNNPTERTDATPLDITELDTFTLTCTNGRAFTGPATSTAHTFTYNRVTESGVGSCSIFVTDTGGRSSSAVTASFTIAPFIFSPKSVSNFGASVVNN